MAQDVERAEGLSQGELDRLVVDFFHRTMVHHTL
jgi:hypothetical protein